MRRAFAVLVVLAVVIGALLIAAPWVARPFLAGMLTVRLGRPVSIGDLSWNVAARTVTAERLAIGTEPERVTVRRVTVAADVTRLGRGGIALREVLVEEPRGTVRLPEHLPAGEPDGGLEPPSLLIPVTIERLRVSDGALRVLGTGDAELPITVEQLVASDIELGGLGGDVAVTAELTGAIAGAPLRGTARVQPTDAGRAVDATLTVRELTLPEGLLPLPEPLERVGGKVTAEVRLVMAGDPPREELLIDARVTAARVQAEGAMLAAPALTARKIRVDLATRRIDVGPVAVERPDLTLDLDRRAAPVPADEPEPSWALRSGPITVRGGRVLLRRGGEEVPLQLESVRWDGLREDPMPLALRARIADGGTLALEGRVDAAPLTLALDVQVEALPVAPWARLFALPLQLRRGTVAGQVDVVYEDDTWRTIDGTLRATDVHTEPPDPARPAEVMAVATADVGFAIALREPPVVTLKTVTLGYPYVLALRRPEGTFPYSLVAGGAAEGAERDARAPVLRIERLTVEGGKLEFLDETVTPTFWTSFTSLTAQAENIAAAGTIERFTVNGLRDELSPVRAEGALTELGLAGEAEVRDVLLDSLNPYVAPVLGYRLTAGRLSSEIRATPAPGALQAVADIVLRGVDVLQTGTDVILEQSGVPLPIALNLLTGVGGSIALTLPFTVDTRSGDVAVGSVVWQAVRKAIVSALSSPLRVLGSLFGLRGAPHAFAVDPIPFATGRGRLDDAGRARVGEIARILEAQQGLLLVLLPQITAEDIAAVGAGEAADLAAARNAAVREAFVSGDAGPALEADRILLADWEPDKGAEATGKPSVYVELQDAP